MAPTVPSASGSGRSPDCDRTAIERSQACDLWRQHLKTAMHDTGWTSDALAAHFKIDRSYVSRMLDGEKPWSLDRIVDLPADLGARFAAIRAEYLGLIVVRPLSGLEAQRAFISGLIGLFAAVA